jgi:hypothetical protein
LNVPFFNKAAPETLDQYFSFSTLGNSQPEHTGLLSPLHIQHAPANNQAEKPNDRNNQSNKKKRDERLPSTI